ncbi:hypothetical protein HIM_06187 [Hirsutella minnesotensis 3608]|uniref:Carrier domain-containing protein n=1 Tax=Hirsutella minnesotensis 3608 TaxID=1043627 RepID=A0A0F7ZZK4_9HYPO|nr:hypothetical protein HIM_06187 [Hirsutella minnesotensis 3608]
MDTLQDVLLRVGSYSPRSRIGFYDLDHTSSPTYLTYQSLLQIARQYGALVQSLPGFRKKQPAIIYLEDQRESICWIWSILFAGGVPLILPQLSNLPHQRQKQLGGLSAMLQKPICITRHESLCLLDGHGFIIYTIEGLMGLKPTLNNVLVGATSRDLALLILTSGSTGNAKAVRLTHGRPFLNWVGPDHVASLVEIHLQALWLGVDQFHVHPANMISSPTLFLDIIERHSICYAFAPNFFLKSLISAVLSEPRGRERRDLSSLAILVSGGEANDLNTCKMVSHCLAEMGAPKNTLTPGFGMTETCAGAIYNVDCPHYDVKTGRRVASVGKCIQGIEMRVMKQSLATDPTVTAPGEAGSLQLRGEVVTKGYYGNPETTSRAFTVDGWFITGDTAAIDSTGRLTIMGREKDDINVNGINVSSDDVQAVLEQALGKKISRIICFPNNNNGSEQVTIAYTLPAGVTQVAAMAAIEDGVVQTCLTGFGCRPLVFCVRRDTLQLLPVSALGKISRPKMRALFEAGLFNKDVAFSRQCIDQLRSHRSQLVSTAKKEDEMCLIHDFAQTLDVKPGTIDINTSIFNLGFTSMNLIRLRHRIETRLNTKISVLTLLKYPTPGSLAAILRSQEYSASNQSVEVAYDPVIVLKPTGNKTPLWLVHPGVGEVLVFVGLAQQLRERPIYALRARGFESGQAHFRTIHEAVETYLAAIRKRQRKGPYAIAGYSYGTMLAFELTKRLEAEDGPGTVRFLGSFNLPPHIKERMRHQDWNSCLLHLAYFLGLVPEAYANNMNLEEFRNLSRLAALNTMLEAVDVDRWVDLGLSRQDIERWADVAYGLQRLAIDYDPAGIVETIDVFHAQPLQGAATSQEDWVMDHLDKWRHFCRTSPRLHAVGGAHYTMIGPEHVVAFASKLEAAMEARENFYERSRR